MSASKRYTPYWFIVFVVLFATLAGSHPEALANGTNAVGNQGRTLRDGGAGCAGSGCHTNQTAAVNISKAASFVLPGGSTVITVAATDTTNVAGLHMGMDLATKKDTAGTTATLTESAGNLLALPSGTEVVHCTATASGCTLGSLATISGANGTASYNVNFNMPAGAVAGETYTLYATARLGLGSSGGSWNHAPNVQVTAGAAPAFTSAPPPGGVVGVAYSHTYTATGTPAPTFVLIGGSLPNNVSLVNGVLSGTPTVAGTFTGTVRATNTTNVVSNVSQPFSITISAAPAAPAITSAAPPATGTVGVAYNHTYTATGNPAPTFALTSGTLPTNVSLNPTTGALTGSPTAAGLFTGTVTASNNVNPPFPQNFSITIKAAPAITSAAPPASGIVGSPYNHTYTATGSPAPTFAVTFGALPTNLQLNPTTGVVSGSPTAVGTFNGTVTASNGVLPNATQNFSITIAAAPTAPQITSAVPPANGTVGVAYNHTYTATGNPAPTFTVSSGALPTNLQLNPNTGVVSGSPTAVGTFNGTVRASNGVLPNAPQNFSITIAAAPVAPVITSPVPLSNGTVGVAYDHTYTATGNPVPTFSVSAGALPTNLQLNPATGVVSGSPTTAGTFTGTVSASNGVVPSATQDFFISVAAASAVSNYQALWWLPTESGWGINLTHQGDVIFATWFTFGADNQPQWFTMVARNTPAEPNVYTSVISSFTGPPFNTEPFPPNANVRTPVGNGKLTFAADGKSATFDYTVNGITQTKQIEPQELFPGQGLLPVCVFGTPLAELPLATNYQSLWWATHGSDLGGDESGWGINFTHHGNVIFATWFTYDVNGKGWWLFSVASLTGTPGVYAGTVRVATGPAFSDLPWEPTAVVRTTVGNATLTFVDGNHATFAYTVNGISQVKNLVRQLFDSANGTVCHQQ